ncbi:hypothetical protein VTN77DRAFT_1762 [Rasamsonia byssochlamydoides]|uniref:uncharacterized protein n=1 Tax=Rasamsonia byssochlamydoides TaxID=89139 RepID=UPI003743BB04
MAEADTRIAIDAGATRNASECGNELTCYGASLTPSVLDYRKENGRRYHGYRDGTYLMPNDEDEADRLDMLHEMMLTLMNRQLFLAPIGDEPRRVLDLGTGTGIWAIDFGDQYTSTEVIGVDLSPIQPSMVPPNVKFLVDDIESLWVYDQPFDFIHARYLATSIKDYKRLLQQAYDNTTPGGWVEIEDWDCRLRSEDGSTRGTSIEQYYDVVINAFEKAGYVSNPGPLLDGWFREVGFENIHVQKYKVPMGGWPLDEHSKKVGLWNLFQAETGFEASAMAVLTRYEAWTQAEVTVLVAKTRNDARNPAIHPIFDYYAVYGQKPKNPNPPTQH